MYSSLVSMPSFNNRFKSSILTRKVQKSKGTVLGGESSILIDNDKSVRSPHFELDLKFSSQNVIDLFAVVLTRWKTISWKNVPYSCATVHEHIIVLIWDLSFLRKNTQKVFNPKVLAKLSELSDWHAKTFRIFIPFRRDIFIKGSFLFKK